LGLAKKWSHFWGNRGSGLARFGENGEISTRRGKSMRGATLGLVWLYTPRVSCDLCCAGNLWKSRDPQARFPGNGPDFGDFWEFLKTQKKPLCGTPDFSVREFRESSFRDSRKTHGKNREFRKYPPQLPTNQTRTHACELHASCLNILKIPQISLRFPSEIWLQNLGSGERYQRVQIPDVQSQISHIP